MSKLCVVAAGGTGGHMFPAEALARELTGRGWRIVLATDRRGEPMPGTPGRGTAGAGRRHRARADRHGQGDAGHLTRRRRGACGADAPGRGRGGGVRRLSIRAGLAGRAQSEAADPAARAERGPGPHQPLAFALCRRRRGVLPQPAKGPREGRCARAAGRQSSAAGHPRPNRQTVSAARAGQPIHLLVTGGSQGSRILSEIVPQALAQLPADLRSRLKVAQQARPDIVETARRIYADGGIGADVAPFFDNMAGWLGQAHLLIGRAGASTCSELAVAGLPSLLIPLKIAMDDHQRFNAQSLADAGGAEVVLEHEVTVQTLTARLHALLSDPARLAAMSGGARSAALPDATARLADMVEGAVEV